MSGINVYLKFGQQRNMPLTVERIQLTRMRVCVPRVLSGASGSLRSWSAWTDCYPDISADLTGVTYGNGKFVAVGGGGEIWISTNGTAWALSGATSSPYLRCVTWGNGLYVAAGNGGGVFTSTDGYQWTARNRQSGGSCSHCLWKRTFCECWQLRTIRSGRGCHYHFT